MLSHREVSHREVSHREVSHRIAILDIEIRDVMLYRQSKAKVLIQTVECFNAQADLSLHCKNMQKAGFSKILVPINYCYQFQI